MSATRMIPSPVAVLTALWDQRDERYARAAARRALTANERAAAVEYRRAEVNQLPIDQRTEALVRLSLFAQGAH